MYKILKIKVGNEIKKAKINVSTSIETVINIEETNHIIELKFQITLDWLEPRAVYNNLKNNDALNVLNKQEQTNLWIPYIIFKVGSKLLTKIFSSHLS